MKKRIIMLMALVTLLGFLTGCSDSNGAATAEPTASNNATEKMDTAKLEGLLSTQPLTVVETKYVVQDKQYKSLYPDMLQAIIQNNTTEDIKDAVVAFVAWDDNNLPVKIEGQFDFSGGSYLKEVNYSDINLIGGDTFGDKNGYSLRENCTIKTFKALVVSYETFDGETWKNPYYDDFRSLYEGKKLN